MSTPSPLVHRLAQHVTHLQYDDIPAEAIQLAKWIVFDTLGTGLGGYQRPLGQKAVRFSKARAGAPQAAIIGDGTCTTAEEAAFANGVLVKILGMDDSHRVGSHIASQLIPAVLAVAQMNGTTGREMLTAIVAAYDVAVRVASEVRVTQRQRGLDVKGTVGAITAAAGAARCLGLDVEATQHALSMAADMSSGTEQYVYEGGLCDTKDLIAGFGARSGVFAALLAQGGFYGPAGALDGKYGFFRAFGSGSHDPLTFDDLGENFRILETGFKPHGGCRHTHQAVDAVQQLLAEAPIDPTEIANIQLATYTSAITPDFRIDPNPKSRDVAGLSIRVATAVALTQHNALPEDYAHWDTPEVQRLRNLVEINLHEEIEANYPAMNGCELQVTLNNGETRKAYLPNMKGEPEFPMTEPEFVEKFYKLNAALFSREQVDQIYNQCQQLESLASLNDLMDMVRVTQ